MRGAWPSHLSQLNFEPLQAHSSLGLFHPTAAISKSEKTQSFDSTNARDPSLSGFSWKIYCCWKTFQAQRMAKKNAEWEMKRKHLGLAPVSASQVWRLADEIPGAMSSVCREGIWAELFQCLPAELPLWGTPHCPLSPFFSSKIWNDIFTFLIKRPLGESFIRDLIRTFIDCVISGDPFVQDAWGQECGCAELIPKSGFLSGRGDSWGQPWGAFGGWKMQLAVLAGVIGATGGSAASQNELKAPGRFGWLKSSFKFLPFSCEEVNYGPSCLLRVGMVPAASLGTGKGTLQHHLKIQFCCWGISADWSLA